METRNVRLPWVCVQCGVANLFGRALNICPLESCQTPRPVVHRCEICHLDFSSLKKAIQESKNKSKSKNVCEHKWGLYYKSLNCVPNTYVPQKWKDLMRLESEKDANFSELWICECFRVVCNLGVCPCGKVRPSSEKQIGKTSRKSKQKIKINVGSLILPNEIACWVMEEIKKTKPQVSFFQPTASVRSSLLELVQRFPGTDTGVWATHFEILHPPLLDSDQIERKEHRKERKERKERIKRREEEEHDEDLEQALVLSLSSSLSSDSDGYSLDPGLPDIEETILGGSGGSYWCANCLRFVAEKNSSIPLSQGRQMKRFCCPWCSAEAPNGFWNCPFDNSVWPVQKANAKVDRGHYCKNCCQTWNVISIFYKNYFVSPEIQQLWLSESLKSSKLPETERKDYLKTLRNKFQETNKFCQILDELSKESKAELLCSRLKYDVLSQAELKMILFHDSSWIHFRQKHHNIMAFLNCGAEISPEKKCSAQKCNHELYAFTLVSFGCLPYSLGENREEILSPWPGLVTELEQHYIATSFHLFLWWFSSHYQRAQKQNQKILFCVWKFLVSASEELDSWLSQILK